MTGRGGSTASGNRDPRGGGGAFVGTAAILLIVACSLLITSSAAAQPKQSAPARGGRPVDPAIAAPRLPDDAGRAAAGSIAELAGTPTSQPTNAGSATPATTPAAGRPRGAFDGEAIRRRSAAASGASTTRPAVPKVAPPASDFRRVALALGIVIALIFVARAVAKRVFPVPGVGGGTRAVQVLARSPLAPKQNLVLLQVGRRVVVVADSGGQMNTLCEIADPDEVASLVGQILAERGAASAKSFGSVFTRMRRGFEDAPQPAASNSVFSRDPMSLVSREAQPRADGAEDDEDPSLSSTRSEIKGLMEKVRMMSGQFKSSGHEA